MRRRKRKRRPRQLVLPGEIQTEQHLRDPARKRRAQRQEERQQQQSLQPQRQQLQPLAQPQLQLQQSQPQEIDLVSVSEDSAEDSLPLPLQGTQLTTQRSAARNFKVCCFAALNYAVNCQNFSCCLWWLAGSVCL